MAADFLQSNRYRSLFLADGILKRIRLKMAKLGDDRFGKPDKEREQQAQKESCDHTQAEFQEYAHQHDATDCIHSSSKESGTVSEIQEENNPSCVNLNGDVAMNDHNITRPKLKINPPNGLVWIPKPPNNPRGTHSSFFNPSSTAGRDQTGESSSRNLTQNATMAASAQKDTRVDAQMSESFFQIDSQDNSLQNHVALDQGQIKESRDTFQAEESIPESDDTHQHITEEKMSLPMITQSPILSSLNEVSADSWRSTGYSDVQEDQVQRVTSEDQDQNLPDDREDDGYAMCNLEADTDDDDVAISTNTNNEYKHANVKDLPKRQAETDGVNDKRGNSSNCGVNDSSNNQAIDSLSNERSEHLTKGLSSECQDDNSIDTEDNMTYEDEVYPPKKPKVMVTNHKREIADINSNKSLSKKNNFLNLMHFLFDMRLKRTDVDEDTEPLVDEEITEDVTRQVETKVKKTKKRWSCRLSIFGQRRDIGETRRVSPSPTAKKKKKKKRRRPRKKNVHRAGRRLRKNLDRGCRNISYGFSYLVTEIPESPPATSSCGTNGGSRSLGYEDDAPNDRLHSDTAAPPNPRKKQFITLEAF